MIYRTLFQFSPEFLAAIIKGSRCDVTALKDAACPGITRLRPRSFGVVANPRLMEGSKRRKRKSDRIDANKLARWGRVDPQSLYPIRHRSREVRQDLVVLRARDALVSVRTLTYNSRLQPLQIYYTTGTISRTTLTQLQQAACPTTSAAIMNVSYNFGAGTNDNGNVNIINDCLHSDRTENFDYDSLNRIKDGYTTGSGPSVTNWGESYTIDAWGNLTNIALYPGKQNSELLNAAPASVNNQLPSFNYDVAGNMTQNGSTSYTYDAENRITATSGYSYVYDADGERVIKCSGSFPTCASGTLYWRGTREPLARQWFFEQRDGNCRLMAPFAVRLSETAPTWAHAVAPFAEWVARTLWSPDSKLGKSLEPATRLTQRHKREAKGSSALPPSIRIPCRENICRSCGKTIRAGRSHCANCAIRLATQRLVDAARIGRVKAQTPEARAKQVDSRRRHAKAISSWVASSQPDWLTAEVYSQKIQPLLAGMTNSAIASRIGVSRWYAGRIRQGYRPHPRHWQALAGLVGMSPLH